MTGFGRGQKKTKFGNFLIEIRSVNHRFLDITMKAPDRLQALEPKIKNEARKRVRRGKVSLHLSHDRPKEAYEALTVDKKVASAYYKLLLKLKKHLLLRDEIRLDQIASFPDVITYEKKEEEARKLWPSIRGALVKALDELAAMKEAEGRRLVEDITKRLTIIEEMLERVKRGSKAVVDKHKRRLVSRVKELASGFEIGEARLMTEVAIFAERSDITEEVTRVASHLSSFKTTLSSDKEVGRTQDFIIQELFREINTISAKAGDYEISRAVIVIKGELEKIREQVQNIE